MTEKVIIIRDRLVYSELRKQIVSNKRLKVCILALVGYIVLLSKEYDRKDKKLKEYIKSEGEK